MLPLFKLKFCHHLLLELKLKYKPIKGEISHVTLPFQIRNQNPIGNWVNSKLQISLSSQSNHYG